MRIEGAPQLLRLSGPFPVVDNAEGNLILNHPPPPTSARHGGSLFLPGAFMDQVEIWAGRNINVMAQVGFVNHAQWRWRLERPKLK